MEVSGQVHSQAHKERWQVAIHIFSGKIIYIYIYKAGKSEIKSFLIKK